MTLTKHEMRQNRLSLAIWTAAICFFIVTCVLMFPEMKTQMKSFNALFSAMGAFTAAFGMDKLNFGTLIGFYAVECGNILGIGGALFATLCAGGMLSKEEKDRTAEFLLTHPVSRVRVVTEKLLAIVAQLTVLNAAVYGLAIGSIAIIGEPIPWKEISLMHLAYYLLQLELAAVCYGISAFMRKGSLGLSIGIAMMMYFMNLVANIAKAAKFLKYLTPFAYCEGSDIVSAGRLNGTYLLIGGLMAACGVVLAYVEYTRKDIHG